MIPEAFSLKMLQALGIPARAPSPAEIAQAGGGRAVYSDLPGGRSAQTPPATASRLSGESTRRAAAIYGSLFGPGDADRSGEVGQSVAESMDRYGAAMSLDQAAEVDPAAFRAWIASNADEAPVSETLAQLEDLLDELAGMGLTEAEYRTSSEQLLERVAASSEGLSVEDLRRLLAADPARTEPPSGNTDPEAGGFM